MVKRFRIGVALAVVAAVPLAATTAGADKVNTAGKSKKAKNIRCVVKLSKQRDPGPNQRGIDFAQITCSKPLGFGAQYDTFFLKPEGNPPSGTGDMRYRAYFDRGRINGTWDVSFAATDKPCDFNFKVVSRWRGGTGAYKKVRGFGRGEGDFTDPEEAPNCDNATVVYNMKVTGLPRR